MNVNYLGLKPEASCRLIEAQSRLSFVFVLWQEFRVLVFVDVMFDRGFGDVTHTP